MGSTRRDFLQLSAGATAALTLLPGRAIEARVRGQQARHAGVRSIEEKMIRARPVSLGKVRLTGGPLKQAQDVTAKYLLQLEPDRMLAFYRQRAGLPQKAEPYGGWDGPKRNLTGHIAGHYLSAVSLMYFATGDAQFKQRSDYIVAELKEVQDKHGDGYLSALEGGRECWAAVSKGDIRSGGFDLNGLWSPWYTLHKTYAGLRDAYRHAGNRTALDVEIKFAEWAEGVLAPLNDAQLQRMLNTEFGGMNEVLADLYADTGDKRWLTLSYKFEHRAFTDPLKRHQDNLAGKHGNTQVPKLIGSASRYAYSGDLGDIMAATFFWDQVAQHHSFATGGHGTAEYFGPPDQLARRVDGRTAESCNVYNMLKLTRRLFSLRPDAHYADFHERALFNHVLASIDPQDGRTSYMVPVGRGVQQEYQNMLQSFTCCVGSGMESHALHGDGMYYESDDTLWVNLFAPSTVEFSSGLSLAMETGFPDGDAATIKVSARAARDITLAIRRPAWAGDRFAITVNGTAVELPVPLPPVAGRAAGAGGRGGGAGRGGAARLDDGPLPAGSFVEIKRTWRTGDTIEVALPKTLRLEPTPDDPRVTAIMWGPLALAADLGPRREQRGGRGGGAAERPAAPAIPVLVSAERRPSAWLSPSPARPGDFRAAGLGRVPDQPAAPVDVSLVPFYRLHRRNYSVYLDLLSPAEWDARVAEIAAERERLRKLEAATVAFVQPGEMQPERDFNYQSDPAERPVQRMGQRAGRAGEGWFSFDVPVDPGAPMALVVTYHSQRIQGSDFRILVDGTQVARFEPDLAASEFHEVRYAVPPELVRGKTKVTVRFQSEPGSRVATIFGLRMIRG